MLDFTDMTLDATTGTIATLLGISEETVEELAGAGLMPAERMGDGTESYWCFDSQAIERMFGIE